jgi:transposase
MAKDYLPVDRDQAFLLPPDMRDWLAEGHPVWLVIDAVRLMDTSAFHARRRRGGAGAAGFDPDMLLTLLVWAYANGITSSRRIERLCQQDLAFMMICAGRAPDHVTVARFRQQFAQTAAPFFAQVLLLCARMGMGQVGVVAIDGTKIAASASRDANRSEEGLRKLAAEMAARHADADRREDALFGRGRRGDDDPGGPRTREERVAAALASIQAEREAAEAAERAAAGESVARARAGSPKGGRGPAAAEVALAEERVARETAAYQAKVAAREAAAAAGRPRSGGPPVPVQDYCRVREAREALERARARAQAGGAAKSKKEKRRERAQRNVTDPDSRLMPVRGGGFLQGYNPQNVTTADGLVIATRLTNSPADAQWYEPMIAEATAAAAMMAAAGAPGTGKIGLALADAGYLSHANLTRPGPDRLIATGKRRDLDRAARAAARGDAPDPDGAAGGPAAAMAARLATPDGIAAYRRRGHIGETFHGDLKHNMGIRRLTVRGLPKASGEWTFATAVRNLRKAITSGHLTTAALAALPA